LESFDGRFVEVVGFLEREEEFGRGGGGAVGVAVGGVTFVVVFAIVVVVIAMAFRWIDDVEGLGFDDGIFDGGKDASFDGSRRRRSRGTGTTGLALTRDGIASPSSSSRSGTAFPSAAMTASTTMPSLSVVTLRLRGICFFAKIVARIRRRGAEGAAGAILGGIGGVVQTGIAAVVGGIAFGGAASSSSVTGATGGADASSGGGMATGASISSLLLLLLLLLRLFGPPIVTMSAGNGILDGAQPPSSCDFGGRG